MRAKRGRVIVRRLMRIAAVLTVVFSLLTAAKIPHHSIELFSHFRLQYFVAAVLLIIVFVVWRKYLYVGALIVVAALNATFILPWYISKDSVPNGLPLKLIHVNVHSSNTEYQRLTDFIREENPDLFFLQEVNADWVAGTAGLLADYPYAYTEPRSGNFGIAAYSKLPFDSIAHVDSPPLDYPTIVATTTFNNRQVTIISSHPTIPVGRSLYEARNIQLESIAELVKNSGGDVVLMGDFNASVWDAHFKDLSERTNLRNARTGFGILPSWPTFLPFAMIPIDHMLVSTGIDVLDAHTGDRIGSDHLPLVVTLSL